MILQGTVLGVLLFIIYFNGAALRPSIPRPSWPIFSKKRNDPVALNMKFVDDLSIVMKINLDKDIHEDVGRPKPLTFDERLETKLYDDNILQKIMGGLEEFSNSRQMKINTKKSAVMKICKSRTKVYPTEIRIGDNFLEVKKELKILGVILTPNLKWKANTDFACKKAFKNMWQIRRMKKLGLDELTLVDYFLKEVRVHLELAVPVWHSGLTLKLSADLERVQRVAVSIILGKNDMSYDQSCSKLGLKRLTLRRTELCERFALKTATKSRHKDLFELKKTGSHEKYREHFCRKKRFFDSPLRYLTRMLNQS